MPRTQWRVWCVLVAMGLIAACGAAAPAVQTTPTTPVLRWGKEAASIETQIATHLATKELVVERVTHGESTALRLSYRGQGIADFAVIVRVLHGRALPGDHEPKRALVLIHLYTFTAVPADKAAAALNTLNLFNSEWAYGAFFLNAADSEVVGVWPVHLTEGRPLPLDVVYDGIVELVRNWHQLQPLLPPPAASPAGAAPSNDAPLPAEDAGPVTRATRTRMRSAWPSPEFLHCAARR